MTAAIEWNLLLQVIWVSLVAGVGVTALFSVVIYGSTRAADASREGHGGQATLYGALAVVAGVLFAAGVIFGLSIIITN